MKTLSVKLSTNLNSFSPSKNIKTISNQYQHINITEPKEIILRMKSKETISNKSRQKPAQNNSKLTSIFRIQSSMTIFRTLSFLPLTNSSKINFKGNKNSIKSKSKSTNYNILIHSVRKAIKLLKKISKTTLKTIINKK